MALVLSLVLTITPMFWPQELDPKAGSSVDGLTPGLDSTLPIPCHSHNDYWRQTPLHSAILAGCVGVEADVWAVQGELYVGHNLGSLSTDRSLSSMYIQPLIELLQTKNSADNPALPPRGVYDREPNQTLVLLVDLKSEPDIAWSLLLEKLEPLRQKGWLSHVSNNTFISRPITVVGTGETEIRMVDEDTPSRDVFLDAPLAELDEGIYSTLNSYYASVSFEETIGTVGRGGLQPTQLAKLRDHIAKAHGRGLKVRYWGMPYWPIDVRNQLWDTLLDEGVDMLNVDDLVEARNVYAKRGRLVK
ncbi:altered inheritance of mitochondria 6 [Fusarium albosuccineum]|uniref:Altered inheritance of mitochondria protein 6 n=1 Tax=Fusarium albosuccineum TaxID=1237068 RepID=A0A8H4LJH1_9HYPO|nr:altered inheritance of mitochondria 6 [Fusarium albosuccineum]